MTTNKKTKPVSAVHRARRQAKHLLVPHKGNGYRPHLIRLPAITAVLAVALLAQVVYGFVTTGHFEVLGRVSNITTQQLLDDTNDERARQGLPALTINDSLSQAAFLKGQDMLDNDYWAHTSPSGVTPWSWLADVGYNYSVAGENLAKNYPTAGATVAAWMGSEAHRENILKPAYSQVGFAVVDGELSGRETTLVVAYYAAPVTGQALATPSSVLASVGQEGTNPLTYFASATQSLSPVSIAVLALLAVIGLVGAVAHHYRDRLPKTWKRSWRVHHGMYTFFGMVGLGVLIILATGGGSL